MAVFDLYSKRLRRQRGETIDVFTYDKLPIPLRNQVVHILDELLGTIVDYTRFPDVEHTYDWIVKTLSREYGKTTLRPTRPSGIPREDLIAFFIHDADTEQALDVIEICFKIGIQVSKNYAYRCDLDHKNRAQDAIIELNTRFNENSIGYQFTANEIIRVDSQLLHTEVVKPALQFLSQNYLAGAQEEFLTAHEHYRHGNLKEAMSECLKALESTMVCIAERRNWAYEKKWTAKNFIDLMFEKELVPSFWLSHFTGLRATLEGGVPTARNKVSGHGQGATPTDVPHYLVGYILHMTASTILFLAEAEANLA